MDARLEDREFAVAQPGADAQRSSHGLQTVGELNKDGIDGGAVELLVQLAQAIDFNIEDGRMFVAALGMFERFLKQVGKDCTIRQLGQRIVVGDKRQRLFDPGLLASAVPKAKGGCYTQENSHDDRNRCRGPDDHAAVFILVADNLHPADDALAGRYRHEGLGHVARAGAIRRFFHDGEGAARNDRGCEFGASVSDERVVT